MTLIVENKDINLYFILYIKKKMLSYLALILNPLKLNVYDEYFNSEIFQKLSGGIKISSRKAIWLAMTKLSHQRYEENTHIFINPNLLYPGTQIPIIDICKMINYGCLGLEPYPVISETFSHFQNNIKYYLARCIRGLGR